MNGSAVVAELGSTLRMFASPFKSIVQLTNKHINRLEKLRRGLKGSRSKKKEDWAKIVGSTYLEYSFGLIPLISDVKDIAETLARWEHEAEEILPPRSKIVSRGETEASETVIQPNQRPNSQMSASFNVHIKKKTNVRVQYVCGLKRSLAADFGSNARLIQLSGFDPSNWVPAIWEAVPWSWLVDYFSNASNVLESAFTSTAQVSWVSKTVSQRTYETRTCSNGIDFNTTLYARVSLLANPHGFGSIKLLRTTVTRTDPGSLGIVPLVFEHPFEDAGKVANMIAVLLSRRTTSPVFQAF
jgi:hypothetical protein